MLAKDPRLDEGAATNHDAGDPCPHPLGRLVVGEDVAVACSRCAGFEAHGMRKWSEKKVEEMVQTTPET